MLKPTVSGDATTVPFTAVLVIRKKDLVLSSITKTRATRGTIIHRNVENKAFFTHIMHVMGLHIMVAFNPRNSYIRSMKVKITERIAFHMGVLYGFLKAKIILYRKEKI